MRYCQKRGLNVFRHTFLKGTVATELVEIEHAVNRARNTSSICAKFFTKGTFPLREMASTFSLIARLNRLRFDGNCISLSSEFLVCSKPPERLCSILPRLSPF